jgi:hypothetical protein
MSISVVDDALEFVKEHPEMFFANGRPAPLACVQGLVAQVLSLGAHDVVVNRCDRWWVVGSSFDWFLPGRTAAEQMRLLLPLPELGPNTSRFEVVVLAYSDAVAVRGSEPAWEVIQGDDRPSDTLLKPRSGLRRVLAFRFPG